MLQPVTFWFTDIRKAALIACIALILSLPVPMWNATQTMFALASTHPQRRGWIIPTTVFIYLFTAIMPVIYFALYRNERNQVWGVIFPGRIRIHGSREAPLGGCDVHRGPR